MNDVTETSNRRAVVLVSGGMDSATAAFEALEQEHEPLFLHASYGQRTESKEYECAKAIADHLDVTDFLSVDTAFFSEIGGSSLTEVNRDVEEARRNRDEIPSTYVPFRNANLLSMAVSFAESTQSRAVFIGAHSEDYSGYPDCRPEFFDAFQRVVDVGTKPATKIQIVAPFAEWSKTDIVKRGLELNVPFDLTWSCYRDEAPACGTCDACLFRLRAFDQTGVQDPLDYAERPTFG